MAAYWRIAEARVLDDHAILVRFTDGLEGVVRFSPDFFQGVFSHLCDPVKFREVAVVDGAITWPGGLDLAPDALYRDIKLYGEQIAAKHILPLPLRERVGERGCEQQYSKQAHRHHRRAEWRGKTTFAREFLPNEANCPIFVNADLIAAGLSPFAPELAAFKAGRIMLETIAEHVKRGESFVFETTLSG